MPQSEAEPFNVIVFSITLFPHVQYVYACILWVPAASAKHTNPSTASVQALHIAAVGYQTLRFMNPRPLEVFYDPVHVTVHAIHGEQWEGGNEQTVRFGTVQ